MKCFNILKNLFTSPLLYACVAELLISGLVTGFPSLYVALYEQKTFSDLPPTDQKVALSSINTLSSIIRLILLVPQGFILENITFYMSMMIHSLLISLGCMLFGFSQNNLAGYVISMTLLGVGGNGFKISLILNVPKLLSADKKNMSTTLLSSFYDASSIMFYVFNLIHTKTQFEFEKILSIFSIIPYSITIFFLVLCIKNRSWRMVNIFKLNFLHKSFTSIKKSFLTIDYLLLNVIFLPVIFFLNFYFSTVVYRKTDATQLDILVAIFTFLNPSIMILSSVVFGKIFTIYRDRLYISYIITCFVTLIWSCLLLIPYSEVNYIQYIQLVLTYLFFILHRCALLAIYTIHMVDLCGGKNFPVLLGISSIIPSLLSLSINKFVEYSIINSFDLANYIQQGSFCLTFAIIILYTKSKLTANNDNIMEKKGNLVDKTNDDEMRI